MKPKDLKAPFLWKERKPVIQNGIFHLPEYYTALQEFCFPQWNEVFGNTNPVCIEFCAGNGTWIAEKARAEPEKNWVAVEMRFDRVQKIWSKIQNLSLSNLFIVCGEAYNFAHYFVPKASVQEIYINFPDPWPKRRHEKHRLMKTTFLDELALILKEKGSVTFVTDDYVYLESTLHLFQTHALFEPTYPAPYYVTEYSNYGTSWFEDLWREKGKNIQYTRWMLK